MRKLIVIILCAAAIAACLAGCFGQRAAAPSPEAEPQSAAAPDTQPAQVDPAAPAETAVPAAEPAPTPEPLRPGTYESADGRVLTVKSDGTCTYSTEVTVYLDGSEKTVRVKFHGTVDSSVFTFTKLTYLGMDMTNMAREAGFEDASQWEGEAAALYAGG